MELNVVWSNKFKKDYIRAKKRGLNLQKLNDVILILAKGEKLPKKYKDHQLSGNYSNFRECHIEPDWLLIYSIDNKELELFLFHTGSHSDLFD